MSYILLQNTFSKLTKQRNETYYFHALLAHTNSFFFRRVVENPDPEDAAEEPLMEVGSPDGLDARIEALLRDWHHSPDLLFSIHPVDGSFLIW